jgi:hypothetical protein
VSDNLTYIYIQDGLWKTKKQQFGTFWALAFWAQSLAACLPPLSWEGFNVANQVKQLIHAMLIENTGRAICDSGGENGRVWQRNAGKTLADFEAEPAAQLEISKWQREGEAAQYDAIVNISLFHHLARALELDANCREFNALECGNWNGEFYGTDQGKCDWLLDNGFTAKGDSFNSYNWSANFSQVIQGQILKYYDDDDLYVLLQIHGGADVRGGYTDAKLFKLGQWIGEHGLFSEDSGFSVANGDDFISVDWRGNGELTDSEGDPVSPELLAKCYQLTGGELVTGELFEINY